MAAPKKTTAPATAPAPAAAVVSPFAIEEGIALPAVVRGVPSGDGESPYVTAMKSLPLATDPAKIASFLVPLDTMPDSMSASSDAEKAKWKGENARKLSNRISGAKRRLVKGDATRDYAIRTWSDTDGNTVGVRVFCVAPKAAPAPATPPPAPATA